MNHKRVSLLPIAIIASAFLVGCATTPPTAWEQAHYDIRTNYVPVVQVKTNVFEVSQTNTVVVYQTNKVTVPGVPEPIFQVVFKTNEIVNIAYQTNTVTTTNQLEAGYVYTPGAGAKVIQETGGAVGNLFGVGGIVSTAIGALFSLWGYTRSRKSLLTAANMAQSIETIREFVKSLPNGQTYDNELVNWLTQHQAEGGVLNNVLELLKSQVSNVDAKDAAQHIQSILAALGQQKPAA